MVRMQLAFLCFNVAEPATWVAILVYAYDQGGTRAVGFVSILLLIPAGLLAPVAAALGDRFRRDRVVRLGYVAQAVGSVVVATVMGASAPTASVYVLAMFAGLVFTTGRPNHHAFLPSLARSPEEVAAGNSVSSLTEGVGGALGAVIAAVALGASGAGAAYGVAAIVSFVGAALTLGIGGGQVRAGEHGPFRPWDLARDAVDGLLILARSSGPRLIVAIAATLALATGVVGVLVVPLAIEVLGLGEPGVGYLSMAWSIGSFVGAGVSVAFVARRMLAWPIVTSGAVVALAAAAMGFADVAAVAALALAIAGLGITLLDVLGRTLLQRTTDDRVLTRVFGAVEALWLLGYGAGSAIAPVLDAALGLQGAFLVAAGLLTLGALGTAPGLRGIDRTAIVPERQLALLGRIAMFAPLPRTDLERLALQLDRIEIPAGTDVIRQGDVGDRFYVVDAGRFEIVRGGQVINEAAEGDFFGEIALLHDVPRTATVRATEDSAVWALDQEEFLATVTGMPQVETAAHAVSAERMRTGSSG